MASGPHTPLSRAAAGQSYTTSERPYMKSAEAVAFKAVFSHLLDVLTARDCSHAEELMQIPGHSHLCLLLLLPWPSSNCSNL